MNIYSHHIWTRFDAVRAREKLILFSLVISRAPDIYAVDLSTAEIARGDHIRGRVVVIIIDAIVSGARPGTIRRVELGDVADEAFTRSHSLSLASSLQLGYPLYP